MNVDSKNSRCAPIFAASYGKRFKKAASLGCVMEKENENRRWQFWGKGVCVPEPRQ